MGYEWIVIGFASAATFWMAFENSINPEIWIVFLAAIVLLVMTIAYFIDFLRKDLKWDI